MSIPAGRDHAIAIETEGGRIPAHVQILPVGNRRKVGNRLLNRDIRSRPDASVSLGRIRPERNSESGTDHDCSSPVLRHPEIGRIQDP